MSISSHHSPFDLQGGFLCLRSQTGLLTWRIRNAWSLIFYLGKGQLPLSVVLLLIFWSFSPQDTNHQSFYPGGANTYREFVMWQALF